MSPTWRNPTDEWRVGEHCVINISLVQTGCANGVYDQLNRLPLRIMLHVKLLSGFKADRIMMHRCKT